MPTNSDIGKRIHRLRVGILGIKSQEQFARRLGGVTRGAVGNWERGQGISTTNLKRIAETFNISFEWLATGKGDPRSLTGGANESLTEFERSSGKVVGIPVRGIVDAGYWQEVERLEHYEMGELVPASTDYPVEFQYALIVRGESLNKRAKDGDRLICLDIIKSGISVKDGDLVIVERSKYGGQIVELTAKRLRKTLHGFELWPESDHPDHQHPIEYELSGDPDLNEVRVIAKVLWIMHRP